MKWHNNIRHNTHAFTTLEVHWDRTQTDEDIIKDALIQCALENDFDINIGYLETDYDELEEE
jgi:hypothetical protein